MAENVTIKSIILYNKYMIIKTRKIIKDYTVEKIKNENKFSMGKSMK